MLRKWWQALLLFIFRKPQAGGIPRPPDHLPAPTEQQPPRPAPSRKTLKARNPRKALQCEAVEPEVPDDGPIRLNRHDRRKFERARRRHDKFVQPSGPAPIKRTRETQALKPEKLPEPPAQEHKDPNDYMIVDEWLEGDGEQVLYEEAELYGEFNFRDSILDQLDRYFVYLGRMRQNDPSAYGLYKQIGATLVPYIRSDSMSETPKDFTRATPEEIADAKRDINLSSWFTNHWPAFGCIAYGTNPRDEKRETVQTPKGQWVNVPKFLYFHRVVRHDWMVQPVSGGKNYIMTVWFDHAGPPTGRKGYYSDREHGVPMEFPIHISADGKIRALKTRGHAERVQPWWNWSIPHCYKEWAHTHGIDVQLHLTKMFCEAARDVEMSSYSMLRVEVNKGDLTAVFGLDPRRTSYFFQDRDIELNEHGSKKRIFHMVRAHVRKDGTKVPTKFRGLREFAWAGYQVRITVPGRDHPNIAEFNVPGDYDSHKEPDGALYGPEVGARLRKVVHRAV